MTIKQRWQKTAMYRKIITSLIFIPLILTFIFGSALSKIFIEKIPFGVLDMDNSAMSLSIVKQFKSHEGFNVCYYAQSYEELNEKIKEKRIQAAIIIPKNFEKDITEMKAPKTMLLIDETNMTIGNSALSYGSAILNMLNSKIQLQVLQAHNMLPYVAKQSIASLSFVERMLYDPQMSYIKYLLYGLIAMSIQQTYVSVLGNLLIIEKALMVKIKIRSRRGLEELTKLGLRILMCMIFSTISASICFYFAGKRFNLPLRGTLLDYFTLISIFLMDLTAVAFILSIVFNVRENYIRFCLHISTISMLTSGYSWPEYMMPKGFAHIVRNIWPFIYVATPLRIISLKGSDGNIILPYVEGGLHYALFWLPIAIGMYTLSIYVIKFMNDNEGSINLNSILGKWSFVKNDVDNG